MNNLGSKEEKKHCKRAVIKKERTNKQISGINIKLREIKWKINKERKKVKKL